MLKLLAAFLMVIDHFAILFIPSDTLLYVICRLIGRLSMPLFAYYVALGFIHTKHFNNYILRLVVMTLVTQLPFTWIIYNDSFWTTLRESQGLILLEHFNIGLTFICGLLLLKLLQERITPIVGFPLILFLCFLAELGDYGLYGVALVVLFYAYHTTKLSLSQCGFAITILTALYTYNPSLDYWFSGFVMQAPAFLSIALINCFHTQKVKLPRFFFYWFYPLHMFILLILSTLF